MQQLMNVFLIRKNIVCKKIDWLEIKDTEVRYQANLKVDYFLFYNSSMDSIALSFS